jgi:hypothetical protein
MSDKRCPVCGQDKELRWRVAILQPLVPIAGSGNVVPDALTDNIVEVCSPECAKMFGVWEDFDDLGRRRGVIP